MPTPQWTTPTSTTRPHFEILFKEFGASGPVPNGNLSAESEHDADCPDSTSNAVKQKLSGNSFCQVSHVPPTCTSRTYKRLPLLVVAPVCHNKIGHTDRPGRHVAIPVTHVRTTRSKPGRTNVRKCRPLLTWHSVTARNIVGTKLPPVALRTAPAGSPLSNRACLQLRVGLSRSRGYLSEAPVLCGFLGCRRRH